MILFFRAKIYKIKGIRLILKIYFLFIRYIYPVAQVIKGVAEVLEVF
jgi:hypothetical protein